MLSKHQKLFTHAGLPIKYVMSMLSFPFCFLSLLFWQFRVWHIGFGEIALTMLHGRRASAIYVNIFSGEATTQLPTAIHMARGGVCLSCAPLFSFQFDLHSKMIMIVIASPSFWNNSTMWSFYDTSLVPLQLNIRPLSLKKVLDSFNGISISK